jgi:hypothetical protein
LKIAGTERTADDAISATRRVPGSPLEPGKKYLVDDKAGSGAFKLDQAQDYSNAFNREGKLTTSNGKQYDGLVYFCDSEATANNIANKINKLNENIHIAYFDSKGAISWYGR